jgi:hypothetical protein
MTTRGGHTNPRQNGSALATTPANSARSAPPELGLAVDVAQNAADAYPNIPSDNAVVSRA